MCLASCCCSFLLHVVANDWYLLSFSSTASTCSSFKTSCWSRKVYPVVLKNLVSIAMFRNSRFSQRCCCKVKHYWVLRCVESIKLDHEDESSKVLRKVENYSFSNTTSRRNELESISAHNFWIKI